MAKAKFVSLGHRERWFLGQLAGMLREGQNKTLDGVNRAGVRLGADCLRLMGLLTPHPGRLPEASGGPGRGTLEGDDQVRLGDADQALLTSLRPCWVDGDGLRWAALNARTLRLAEEHLRYMGMLDDYPGESVFDDLVTPEGSFAGPNQPIRASINGGLKTEEGSGSGTLETKQNSEDGSDKTDKEADTDDDTPIEPFVWDLEAGRSTGRANDAIRRQMYPLQAQVAGGNGGNHVP